MAITCLMHLYKREYCKRLLKKYIQAYKVDRSVCGASMERILSRRLLPRSETDRLLV